jgi:hypothetical protein
MEHYSSRRPHIASLLKGGLGLRSNFVSGKNELHPPLRLILDAIQNDAGVPWGQEQNFGIAIETRDPP